MRGDLHTLKKVCSYASVVMLIGEIAFASLVVASAAMGIVSFSSPEVRETFTHLIKCGDTDLSLAAGTAEMVVLFITMFVTVKMIHDIMVSIQKEHSPFMDDNAARFKTLCLTFLIASVPISILEYLNRGDQVLAVCLFLAFILICVVMYCLTIVFRYGAALQDESDHTL
jgi:hypothetical protein